MTVAIAICCNAGVVLATDSMGSSGEVATVVAKVHTVPNSPVAWATAGTEFLTQTIEASVSELPESVIAPSEVSEIVSDRLRQAYDVPIVRANASEADTHKVECLFVGFSGGQPSIIHLPDDLAPVECRSKTFVAIGSGHHFAHVCRTLLDGHFHADLTLEQAKMLAYRIVSTVCAVSSWGVALPVQMSWVSDQGATEASRAECERIDLAVQRWTSSEASAFGEGSVAPSGIPSFGSHRDDSSPEPDEESSAS